MAVVVVQMLPRMGPALVRSEGSQTSITSITSQRRGSGHKVKGSNLGDAIIFWNQLISLQYQPTTQLIYFLHLAIDKFLKSLHFYNTQHLFLCKQMVRLLARIFFLHLSTARSHNCCIWFHSATLHPSEEKIILLGSNLGRSSYKQELYPQGHSGKAV